MKTGINVSSPVNMQMKPSDVLSGKNAVIGSTMEMTSRGKSGKESLNARAGLEEDVCSQAEDMLRESERQYVEAFMAMPALVALARLSDSAILDVNQKFCDVIGLDRQQLVGRSVMKLGIGDCPQPHGLGISFPTPAPTANEIAPFRNRQGDIRYGLLAPVFIKIGGEACVLIILQDVTELQKAQQTLIDREEALQREATKLEDVNTTLKALLEIRNEDKLDLEDQFRVTVCDHVLPYLQKLKNSETGRQDQEYVEQLEQALMKICAPYFNSVKSLHLFLTPREMEIAGMIREGKKTKDIADILHLSHGTVESHRNSIRRKLGLPDKKERLVNYLMSLD